MSRSELFADVYRMDYPRRGKAVIINNENFSPQLGLNARTGTNIDANGIETRLELLGVEVERRNDATYKVIRSMFKQIADEDHSECDCFVGVLLSHGEKDNIYGTDGQLELKEIFEYYNGSNCKSLAGKPKIFFIQACRGNKFDHGTDIDMVDAKGSHQSASTIDTVCETIRLPNEADFLISYSTVPGYAAWRNNCNGSWFIQALLEVLDECGTTSEMVKLLTKVNLVVAYDPRFQSNTLPLAPALHGKKQVPSFTSMLTKELYFVPKTEEGSRWCSDKAADSQSDGGEVESAKKKTNGVTDLVAQFERLQKII